MSSANEQFCDAAEEAFEQFSGTMQTMAQVFEEGIVAANDYMRAFTDMINLVPELADDALNEAEEERCLRRSVRCGMMECMLGGSTSGWELREDVAKVISHRDGRVTVFARMFPRLSYGEVKRLQRDLKRFLPEGTDVKLMAVWEKRRKR